MASRFSVLDNLVQLILLSIFPNKKSLAIESYCRRKDITDLFSLSAWHAGGTNDEHCLLQLHKSQCTSWSSNTTFPNTLETNTEDDSRNIYIDATMSTLNLACKEVVR